MFRLSESVERTLVRHIELLDYKGRLFVVELCGLQPRFTPFLLPRLPLEMMLWCQRICELIDSTHHVCSIVLLLVDHRSRRWQPLLPTQHCSHIVSSLDLRSSDFKAIGATQMIAGTFQSSGNSGLLAAHQAVPPFDGIHVIQQRAQDSSYIFIVCDGQATLANPTIVTVDDVKQSLDASIDRLHFD